MPRFGLTVRSFKYSSLINTYMRAIVVLEFGSHPRVHDDPQKKGAIRNYRTTHDTRNSFGMHSCIRRQIVNHQTSVSGYQQVSRNSTLAKSFRKVE
jgi:hypothetical protein